VSPLRPGRRVLALAVPATLLFAAQSAASLSPAKIVAKLNGERAALGIPAVTLNKARTAGCRAHDTYMRRNRQLTHFELAGRRGYSKAGDRAARTSVLAGPRSGWASHDPWRDAPIHLSQVLNPGLKSTGAYDSHGYSCLATQPTTRPRMANTVWTLPADGGEIAGSQTAFEAPAPPQQTVGIANGRQTGPYLYVWSAAPSALSLTRLVSGTLIGPDGLVATKVIDSSLLDRLIPGLGQPGNGWLLPVSPLKAGAAYRATIVLGSKLGVGQFTHSWSFTATAAHLGP
jgi:hypothetical protein